jgi:hypothetical protein
VIVQPPGLHASARLAVPGNDETAGQPAASSPPPSEEGCPTSSADRPR